MSNGLDILKERGFIEKATHDAELEDYFKSGRVTCYIGFDPTAPSLHIGNLVPMMALAHMNRSGYKAIAVVGGGTGLIGDPSGKNKTRKSLSFKKINENITGIKKQLAGFTSFKGKDILILNNADWLCNMNYISFLRDVGSYFSINRMIKAESYKKRIDSKEGLNFVEFNYMVLQAYDFNKLYEDYDCRLQLGGSDQWGNMVAGINLIRRKNKGTSFGLIFPLITNSSGEKMGKTVSGAIWLDSLMTSPYDYYQFWVNTKDNDLKRFMLLFTFLPKEEINELSSFDDKQINYAKSILAFEATSLAHGEKEGTRSHEAAAAVFGRGTIPDGIFPSSNIPRQLGNNIKINESSIPVMEIDIETVSAGIPAFRLFNHSGLTESYSAARRLIKQGGGYINGERIEDPDYVVKVRDVIGNTISLRAGKKRFVKIKVFQYLDKTGL